MNKTLGYSLSFVAGLVIGGFAMKKYIDKKMKEAEELVECTDDKNKEESNNDSDKDDRNKRPSHRQQEKTYSREEVNEYKDLCNKYDIVKKDFQEEVDEMSMHDAKFDPANYEDVRQPIYEDEDEFEEEIDYNEGFYDPDDDDDMIAPSENYDYDTKSKFSDADHNSKPYNIPREEFEIYDDYDTTGWTYYPDGYMTDEEGLPIDPEEVRKVVGDEFPEWFGIYCDDEIWVRNDRLKIDVSIVRDLENFRDCQPVRIKRLAGIFD